MENFDAILKTYHMKALREIDSSLISNNIEIWKKIKGFDNYKISNMGRVKSVLIDNVTNKKTERIFKPVKRGVGYYYVILFLNKKRTHTTVHRLVALAFIPNPSNKRCVDHIDCNKRNNNLNNLQYATHQENQQNRSINKRNTTGVKGDTFYKASKKWRA